MILKISKIKKNSVKLGKEQYKSTLGCSLNFVKLDHVLVFLYTSVID